MWAEVTVVLGYYQKSYLRQRNGCRCCRLVRSLQTRRLLLWAPSFELAREALLLLMGAVKMIVRWKEERAAFRT